MKSVNLDRIREATMDDKDFMQELIRVYLDDTPHQLAALSAAVEKQDSAAAAAAAHRLKGSSGNVGAEMLMSLCKRLELSGRADRVDDLPELLEQIDQEFSRVRELLAAVGDDPS